MNMKAIIGAGVLAASLSACASVPQQATGFADYDSASFAVRSWGFPVSSWEVQADGSGTYRERDMSDESVQFGQWTTLVHTLGPDARMACRLGDALAALPATPPTTEDCRERVTDMPYGSLSVTRANVTTEYRFDTGCLSGPYADYIARLREVDAVVADRGKTAPVTGREAPQGR